MKCDSDLIKEHGYIIVGTQSNDTHSLVGEYTFPVS